MLRLTLTTPKIATILVALAVLLASGDAAAWKPATHIFLAEQARRDALDGKMPLTEVSFWNGRMKEALGDFTVSDDVKRALTNHADVYRAGVLGPDAYPDMVFGQTLLHPDQTDRKNAHCNTRARGALTASQWMDRLWAGYLASRGRTDITSREKDEVLAFVLGYFAHAAGDMFGHTYVNDFAGGTFELVSPTLNGQKHMALEGVIGKFTELTPEARDIRLPRVIGALVYETFIDATRTRGGRASALWDATEPEWCTNVPGIFTRLREGLLDEEIAYVAQLETLRADALGADRRCRSGDVFACGHALLLRGAIFGFETTHSFTGAYVEDWIADLDAGLRAWPSTSTALARCVFTDERSDRKDCAVEALGAYKRRHLLPMLGAPEPIRAIAAVLHEVNVRLDAILEQPPLRAVREAAGQVRDAFLSWMLEMAIGVTLEDLSNPVPYLDRLLPNARAQLTREMGFPAGTAPGSRVLDPNAFPPAFNTVRMIQLTYLGASEANRLASELGHVGPAMLRTDQNVMLGFMRSLDAARQWFTTESTGGVRLPPMAFARECGVYTSFFRSQRGDEIKRVDATGRVAWPDGTSCIPVLPFAVDFVELPWGSGPGGIFRPLLDAGAR